MVNCKNCGKEVDLLRETHICKEDKKIDGVTYPKEFQSDMPSVPPKKEEMQTPVHDDGRFVTIQTSSQEEYDMIICEKLKYGFKVASAFCGMIQNPSGKQSEKWMAVLINPDGWILG